MTDRKVRILFFTLGLFLGIILGGSVVRVYADKMMAETTVSKNFMTRMLGKVLGLIYSRERKTGEQVGLPTGNVPAPGYPTESDSTTRAENLPEQETLNAVPGSSSDSGANHGANHGDDSIVVLKDQLVSSVQVPVTQVLMTGRTGADSLNKKGQPQKNAPTGPNPFPVEFWQSPLNYKGYQLGKNKLILYGLNESEKLQLFLWNGGLFLKVQEQFVRLERKGEFKSFEKITDPTLLAPLQAAAAQQK